MNINSSLSASGTDMRIHIAPFRERYTRCASCRGGATLLLTVVDAATGDRVGGDTTTCERHRQTWARRLAARFGIPSQPEQQAADRKAVRR